MEVAEMIQEIQKNCIAQSRAIDKRFSDGNEKFAIYDLKHATLEKWKTDQNGTLSKLNLSILDLCKKQSDLEIELIKSLSELKQEVNNGRPSWATALVITFLSSIAVGAIIALVR